MPQFAQLRQFPDPRLDQVAEHFVPTRDGQRHQSNTRKDLVHGHSVQVWAVEVEPGQHGPEVRRYRGHDVVGQRHLVQDVEVLQAGVAPDRGGEDGVQRPPVAAYPEEVQLVEGSQP